MPVLKLWDYEVAYIQLEENGEKYPLLEYTPELAEKVKVFDEKAAQGDRAAMQEQMHLLTGIPIDKLSKLPQYKINDISQFCVEQNVHRKKKDKNLKKYD